MPPLYRKIKALQLRQIWRTNPNTVLARYHEAIVGVQVPPLQADPSVEQMITVILDREEAEQSSSQVMRAIAA